MKESEKMSITLRLMQGLWDKGSWCGETHLQKSMFFLEVLGEIPLNYDFILYKHGPYSFAFREDLARLRSLGLAELELNPPYGPRYRLSAKGVEFLDRNRAAIKPWGTVLKNVAECLGDKKVGDLEKLGTALLLSRQEAKADMASIASKINKLKPHVSEEEARQALRQLHETILPCFAGKGCPA